MALLKKIGKILNPVHSALPETPNPGRKKNRDKNRKGDLRKGTHPSKDSLPEADLTTNLDRYRHPSEF